MSTSSESDWQPEPSTTKNCWPPRAPNNSPQSRDSKSKWTESEKHRISTEKNSRQPPHEVLIEILFRPKIIRTISGGFGINQQIRIRFSSSQNFSDDSHFGVSKVQSHAMRLYMCMCCGLSAPTQSLTVHDNKHIQIYLYIKNVA